MKFKVGDWVKLNAAGQKIASVMAGVKARVIGDFPQVPGTVRCDFGPDVPDFRDQPVAEEYLEIAETDDAKPPRKAKTPPLCSFCGGDNVATVYVSNLRCQTEKWSICGRVGCFESRGLHLERLEAGLVDCAETRASTRAWYLAKREREEREARAARLKALVP